MEGRIMFSEGDRVISNGVVCVIDRIERMNIPHTKLRKNYYVMHDAIKSDNVFYIPVDGDRQMRYPMEKAEAQSLIERIPEIEKITITSERFRDEDYRKCIKESSPEGLVASLKFFIDRKLEKSSNGKTLSAVDEKYMKIVTRNLYSELASSLEIPVEEVGVVVSEKIK